jgi:phenylacetate-CoA ligase
MATRYWDAAAETMCRGEIEEVQLERLRSTVDRALKTPFYRPRLEAVGISSAADIRGLADIRRIPYTTKDDLRTAYPYGMVAVDRRDIVRMHASSGTTGTPTVIYLTQADVARAAEYMARSIAATGADSGDVFQNIVNYGLFTGGLVMHYGAERVGMMVIPSGTGNTARQIKLMRDFGTTTVHATPSYLLHIHSKLGEEGVGPGDLKLERAFCGAEPYTEDTRRKIESLFGIDVFNSYGLSEMNGPGVAFECEERDGMHLWEDGYILEVIDRDTLEPVPDGELGELVLTILCRDAMPILRYRTRDLTSVLPEPCRCGRTHRRIARITGRSDDMLIINGINIFPSQIEEVVMAMPEVGTNYLILVEKEGTLDRLTVKVEVGPRVFADDSRPLNALRDRIRARLQASISINPRVELHEPGVLPVSEGKAKRVIDERIRL